MGVGRRHRVFSKQSGLSEPDLYGYIGSGRNESGPLLLGRHEYGRLHEGVLSADFREHIRWPCPRSCSCSGYDPARARACSCSHAQGGG